MSGLGVSRGEKAEEAKEKNRNQVRPELDACNGRFSILGSAAIESSRLERVKSGDVELREAELQSVSGRVDPVSVGNWKYGPKIRQLELGLHGSGLLKRSRVSEARGYGPRMERMKLQQVSL